MNKRTLRFESLENRKMLSASPNTVSPPPPPPPPPSGNQPVVVAPSVAGDAPILLPPGLTTAPPNTTPVSPPPSTTGLPAGLPPIVGQAEQIGVTAFQSFQTNHPTAVPTVTDHVLADGEFTLTVTESDGAGDSVTETIIETPTSVSSDHSPAW